MDHNHSYRKSLNHRISVSETPVFCHRDFICNSNTEPPDKTQFKAVGKSWIDIPKTVSL